MRCARELPPTATGVRMCLARLGGSPSTQCHLPIQRAPPTVHHRWWRGRPARRCACRRASRLSPSPSGLISHARCVWRPNGDVFVAESAAGRLRVLRTPSGAAAKPQPYVFAEGLTYPFGIAFWPPGPSPRFVYVAEMDRVVRFPYQPGDLRARGKLEIVVPHLPTGGHATRDLVFSPDGRSMFVSVGSATNAGPICRRLMQHRHVPGISSTDCGSTWGGEQERADVLVFEFDGGNRRTFATGLRNCTAEAMQPVGPGADRALWCVVNERDGLGDDLPPDYATSVRQGAFYGWPWYYIRPA